MSSVSQRPRSLWLASAALFMPFAALAQSGSESLPSVTVDAPQRARPAQRAARPTTAAHAPRAATGQRQRSAPVAAAAVPAGRSVAGSVAQTPSLTAPGTAEAQREAAQVPGSVVVIPAESYRTSTPSNTIKDILDYVPGVFAQPKWGDDTRLSIRGSSLSRNFHLRGVQLYMDGIPINTADGYGDFQEIDPTAYRHVEVFKGANALRFGANSLGGAINFVTATGRDAQPNGISVDGGSFGFRRLQFNLGGTQGNWDGYFTGSAQGADGFRNHSEGSSFRGSGNIGYRVSDDVETRFYFNANSVRQQIPGSVTRNAALTFPTVAALGNITGDQQRNIDTLRLANKTTLRFDKTVVDFGVFYVNRHLMHPIFQYLDYRYNDYGGFVRATDDREIGGFRNRFIAGVNLHNGTIDNQQFANLAGNKGALLSSSLDRAQNTTLYAENSFYILPNVALVAGTQFVRATRSRENRFASQSGSTDFNLWSPKAGLLWNVTSAWQVFANVSRSAEVPSFGESSSFPAPVIPWTSIRPQRATTYEIGTRGRTPDLTWDLAVYRADIRNELLCLYSAFGNCNVTNANATYHQGVEAALGATLLKNILTQSDKPDRLWLNLAYTFSDFRFRNDPLYGNNQLPGAPRHYLRAELLYKHPSGLYVGPNLEWVPQAYFVDSANTLKTQAYALIGLKAGYDNGGNWSAYIEGRNLANTKYIASASILDKATAASPLFEPGTGRAIYAGLKYRW
ncbi:MULTISPECIES: TonB-dependent receptor [unclassified Beijerinckia]|uniref:TonB-dependent receptor family protein n=1 Tax=unclassified Beijerinckia TaxID=2638183 RepID=UPI00089BC20B|nr:MULTISPECIES: TonB-dependent receptor [unclassified Beijerinckia]MDH7797193.1 iron complex outermembrane receptor protein [Beijerinckia sp. GAS462]SEC75864.1 iron complex outermembrane recepter protein [Beijerinckia sp. 28-YEA-48]